MSTTVISEYRNGVYEQYVKNPEHLINVKNGLLDLSTRPMTLRPHTPEVFCTIQLDVNYRPEAVCPTFDRFLSNIYAVKGTDKSRSTNDEAVAESATEVMTEARKRFLLKFMGAIFSNVHADHFNKQVLFLYGPADTGKTVLLNLVERITGSYVTVESLRAVKSAKIAQKMSSQINNARLAVSAYTVFIDKKDEHAMKTASDAGFNGFCWFNMNSPYPSWFLNRS